MKKGWEIKKLGDVCEVIAGQSPESKFYNQIGKGLPFYQGKKDFGIKYLGSPTVWTSKNTKIAQINDILISVRAPVGPVNITTQKICIGRGLAAIRASARILREYLFNFLLKKESEIESNIGAVFNSISKTQIENIRIPLPPLSEQRQIVSILDEAFAAIAEAKLNTEKNLQNAKDLFTSYLNSVFSNPGDDWQIKKLGDCFKLKSGSGLTVKELSLNGNYPVYGGNGIVGMHDEFNLTGDNIIVGRVGAQCGNVRFIKEKIWLTDNAFRIVEYTFEFDLAFLTFLLNFKNLKEYSRQTAQPVISNSSLKNILLHFPKSILNQKLFAEKFQKLRNESQKLQTLYTQKLNALEELKKSILNKAFNGELTLKHLEDVL